MSEQLMLSAEDFPVRTSAAPAAEPVCLAPEVGYGLSTPDLLASFDPASFSWRTSLRCFIEGWMPFSDPWPRSGMMRSGIAYQLPPLAPLTYGTGFGSSPTHSIPTPTASDHIERRNTTGALNYKTNKAVSLDRWVKMWPTPAARDHKGQNSLRSIERSLSAGKNGQLGQLPNAVLYRTGEAGQLNPTWVEWLMGFPIGHTDLSPLETPSSRKSLS